MEKEKDLGADAAVVALAGSIASDAASHQRDAFWEAFEAKQRVKAEVKRGPARITRIA